MSYKEFWHNDLSVFLVYMNSYETRKKEEFEFEDSVSWRLGSYILSAIKSEPIKSFPLHFCEKKDLNKILKDLPQYPKKPICLSKYENKKEEVKNETVLKEKTMSAKEFSDYIKSKIKK